MNIYVIASPNSTPPEGAKRWYQVRSGEEILAVFIWRHMYGAWPRWIRVTRRA